MSRAAESRAEQRRESRVEQSTHHLMVLAKVPLLLEHCVCVCVCVCVCLRMLDTQCPKWVECFVITTKDTQANRDDACAHVTTIRDCTHKHIRYHIRTTYLCPTFTRPRYTAHVKGVVDFA